MISRRAITSLHCRLGQGSQGSGVILLYQPARYLSGNLGYGSRAATGQEILSPSCLKRQSLMERKPPYQTLPGPKRTSDSGSKLGQRRRRWLSFDPESIRRVIRIGTWMCNQHLSCRLCVTWRWQQDKLCPDVFSGSGLNPGPRGCNLRK